MAAWLPVSASILAVSGLAATLGTGSDCMLCTAPSSTATATTAVAATADPIEEAPQNDKMKKHEVYVLKFHADWCPRCKSLDPVYSDVTKKFGDKPVGFVKVDVTNDKTKKASAAALKELGLEDVWSKNKGRNGFILVVDAGTQKEVSKLKAGTTTEQASKAIASALSS